MANYAGLVKYKGITIYSYKERFAFYSVG